MTVQPAPAHAAFAGPVSTPAPGAFAGDAATVPFAAVFEAVGAAPAGVVPAPELPGVTSAANEQAAAPHAPMVAAASPAVADAPVAPEAASIALAAPGVAVAHRSPIAAAASEPAQIAQTDEAPASRIEGAGPAAEPQFAAALLPGNHQPALPGNAAASAPTTDADTSVERNGAAPEPTQEPAQALTVAAKNDPAISVVQPVFVATLMQLTSAGQARGKPIDALPLAAGRSPDPRLPGIAPRIAPEVMATELGLLSAEGAGLAVAVPGFALTLDPGAPTPSLVDPRRGEPASATAAPPAPAGPDRTAAAFAQPVLDIARDLAMTSGSGDVRFTVRPEALGTVAVTVARGDEGASIALGVDTVAALATMRAAEPLLLEAARQAGAPFVQVNVDLNGSRQRRPLGEARASTPRGGDLDPVSVSPRPTGRGRYA